MYSLANYRFWPLGATLALAAACGAEEIQLEPMYAALNLDDPVAATWEDGTTCLTLDALMDPQAKYEARLNGRPIQLEDVDKVSVVGGGTTYLCVPSGEYDLSLHKHGRSFAHTGILSMRPRAHMIILVHGAADAPSLKATEVDRSDPGAGLRRLRITNLIDDGQPVQLIYYDEHDVEVARSEIVAHGDTWTGTISTAITSWRFDPTQDPAFPVYMGFGSSTTWDYLCVETSPTGLVLTRRSELSDSDPYGPYPYAYKQEQYLQPPAVCTIVPIDPELCPDCTNDSVPWPASCATRAGEPTVCVATN
jgi:hypothetical protein